MDAEERLSRMSDAWRDAATTAMLEQLLAVAGDNSASSLDRAAALREARRIIEPRPDFDVHRYLAQAEAAIGRANAANRRHRAQRTILRRPRFRASVKCRATPRTMIAHIKVDTGAWEEYRRRIRPVDFGKNDG